MKGKIKVPLRYGKFGVLSKEEGKVQCHICGKWYRLLGSHVVQKHKLLADEYREVFGLGYLTGLLGEEYREKCVKRGKQAFIKGLLPWIKPHPPTKEAIAKMHNRPQRPESFRASRLNNPAVKVTMVERICIVCGKREMVTLGNLGHRPRTCSDECLSELRSRNTRIHSRSMAKAWWDKFKCWPVEKQREWIQKSLRRRGVPLPKVTVQCQTCGKSFEVPQWLAKIRKYCSHKCAYIAHLGRKATPETRAKLSARAKERHIIEGSFFGGSNPKDRIEEVLNERKN